MPVPGTTKPARLTENLGGTQIELNENDLSAINEAIAKIDVQGDRYLPQQQQTIDR